MMLNLHEGCDDGPSAKCVAIPRAMGLGFEGRDGGCKSKRLGAPFCLVTCFLCDSHLSPTNVPVLKFLSKVISTIFELCWSRFIMCNFALLPRILLLLFCNSLTCEYSVFAIPGCFYVGTNYVFLIKPPISSYNSPFELSHCLFLSASESSDFTALSKSILFTDLLTNCFRRLIPIKYWQVQAPLYSPCIILFPLYFIVVDWYNLLLSMHNSCYFIV